MSQKPGLPRLRTACWFYLTVCTLLVCIPQKSNANDKPNLARQFSLIQQTHASEISDDGNYVAFLWDITGKNEVWVYDIQNPFPSQITFFDQDVVDLKWIPKSTELVITLRNDQGNDELYKLDRFGYHLKALSDNPNATFILKAFSRDGAFLAYASNKREPNVLDAYLINLKTLKHTLIAAENQQIEPISFSPKGSYVLISKGNPQISNHLFLVNAKTLKQIQLTNKKVTARYEGGNWTPDGKGFYTATTYKRDQKTLALMTLVKRRRKIVRGKLSPIDLGDACLTNFNLSNDGKYFTYSLLDEGNYHTVIQNLKTRRNIEIEDAHDLVKVGFTADSQTFILTYSNATNPSQTVLFDPQTKKQTAISRFNLAGLSAKDFVKPQTMSYISFDRAEIPGLLFMPKGSKVDSSLTMVVIFQSNPSSGLKKEFKPLIQYLISQNFAVLAPAIRGSAGYGEAYLNADNGKKRLTAIRDAIKAADWVAQSGLADPGKIVALGCEYGGFLSHHVAASDSGSWAAAISINGYMDLRAMVNAGKPYLSEILHHEYGDPKIDADFLRSISPQFAADSLYRPLLMIYDQTQLGEEKKKSMNNYIKIVKKHGGLVETEFLNEKKLAKPKTKETVFSTITQFIDKHVRYRE